MKVCISWEKEERNDSGGSVAGRPHLRDSQESHLYAILSPWLTSLLMDRIPPRWSDVPSEIMLQNGTGFHLYRSGLSCFLTLLLWRSEWFCWELPRVMAGDWGWPPVKSQWESQAPKSRDPSGRNPANNHTGEFGSGFSSQLSLERPTALVDTLIAVWWETLRGRHSA